ncbi:MAG: hypothetical protein PHY47_01145 [Lachnospiraceae bacterium]|nr:hypothetical protein [Lachnospiraceae bacterium]
MKVQPTMYSRKEIFDAVLNHYYFTPLSEDGDVLNHYEKAMEYLIMLPLDEKQYYSWGINNNDPDVEKTLEVVITDNNNDVWLYIIPYDKNFTRMKFNLNEDELNKKLGDS